jgi:GT2 family glycosyltransferase
MNNNLSDVTICVVPRERFSCSIDSLNSIVTNTDQSYKLIYIDGNSPPETAQALEEICRFNNFTYIRQDRYLTPNQARNICLSKASTRYVACVDNDLFVTSGWLQSMMACATDTGAWAVTPIIQEGSEKLSIVHMAGGDLMEERVDGYNRVRQRHRHMYKTLESISADLVREPVGAFEFHCVLLRTDVFDTPAFLDEGYLAHREHLDHAREIRLAGGQIYFEPRSVVRYDSARPFEDSDREYFELRWGLDWSSKTIEYNRRKWGLAPDDASLLRLAKWAARHRGLFHQSQKSWERHIIPILIRKKMQTWLEDRKLMPERKPR